MKIKPFLFGLLLSIITIEIPLHIFYGSPDKHLKKQISRWTYYYEIEPFKKLFTKTQQNGKFVYLQQKNENRFLEITKSSYTKRIFIIGESIAQFFGESYAELENMFKSQLPQYNFEVINYGQGGYESTRIFLISKEIINYPPDLIILMLGNNISLQPLRFNKFTITLYLNSWVYYTLKNLTIKIKKNKEIPWEKLIKLYETNLVKIAKLYKDKKIPLIFFTVPINLRHNVKADILPLENKNFFLGKIYFENGKLNQAKKYFYNYIENTTEENKKNIAYYYLAQIYEKENNLIKAKELFIKTSIGENSFNNFIKEIHKNEIVNNKNLLLIDLKKIFEDISPNNLPGNNIFQDEVHWYYEWNELVNYEIVKNIYIHNLNFNTSIIAPANQWNFSLKQPDVKKIYESIVNNSYSYFINIINSLSNTWTMVSESSKNNMFISLRFLIISENSLKFFTKNKINFFSPQKIKPKIKNYIETALNNNYPPSKIPPNAIKEITNLTFYYIGEVLRINKQYTLALEYFNEVIQSDPNNKYAYLLRGLTYYNMKNYKKAKSNWQKVIQMDNEFSWLLELL